jgi:AcrR family transcriptional regulator
MTEVEARILQATLDELAANGFEGLTVERVAAAACVGRATIYRHWPRRADLVMDAVRSVKGRQPVSTSGSLRGDLIAQATGLSEALSSTAFGTILPAIIEAARRDEDLAALHRVLIDEKRAEARGLVDAAVDRGEVPATIDRDLVLDLVVGPVFYRHLVRHQATTPAEVEAIVDSALVHARVAAPI